MPFTDKIDLVDAYIGESFKIEINSDLRWATLAWLQAQWWDDIAYRFNSYILDSTGLRSSTSTNDVAFLYKNIPTLNSNNKISIKVTWYLNTYSNNWCSMGTFMTNTLSFPSAFWATLMNRRTCWGSPTLDSGIVYNETVKSSASSAWYAAWNVTLEATINLSTWLVSYNLTSPTSFTTTYTLSSAELNNVLTYKYVWAYAQKYNADGTLYTVELTVE